ncbi:MAG: FAD-dependent oxidoreductase, partial [Williamsia herbipolensis]|nr:FAD-dependent oxidoreductase [Williamsia herbipolensis]
MADASEDVLDLVVVGGGVMGLFTAYSAVTVADGFDRVAVLDNGTIGAPTTASYGRTRSYRKDYLDPLYVRLAADAMTLWDDFEHRTGTRALVRCGCMNIAAKSVTPELAETYAQQTTDVMTRMGVAPEQLSGDEIAERYPYLRADIAHLDPAA